MATPEDIILAGEIRNKFNIHYDNIASAASPGFNDYEISVFLTQAHREVIFNYYNGNSKGDSYDTSEKTKSVLSYYTKEFNIPSAQLINVTNPPTNNLQYKDAQISEDVWYILKENIIVTRGSRTSYVLVKPITEDNFWVLEGNPFKMPNNYDIRAWRLNLTVDGVNRLARIAYSSGSVITSYNFTALIKPEVIVLSSLSSVMTGLTIEGITDTFIPQVLHQNPWLTDMIIGRAVEIATRDYKQNNLDTQIGLNQRVE